MLRFPITFFGGAGGGGAPVDMASIFSVDLYTGNGSSNAITGTGVNLSANEGALWIKVRNTTGGWRIFDTISGATKYWEFSASGAEVTDSTALTSFDTDGFTVGALATTNNSSDTFVGFSLKSDAGFFDVVHYTGTGANATINHDLGAVPGMIIIKDLTGTNSPRLYHSQLNGGTTPANYNLTLNSSNAEASSSTVFNNTTPTSSVFSIGGSSVVNTNGNSYVAFVFGHEDASDGRIYCGEFATDGSGNASVSLPFEPQFVFIKSRSSGSTNFRILDSTRGFTTGNDKELRANSNAAEVTGSNVGALNSGGFDVAGMTSSSNFIFMAIRKE